MSMEFQKARQNGGSGSAAGAGYGAGAPLDRRGNDGCQRSGPAGGGDERFARILGWFSLGLGLAQIAAPDSVARWIGVSDDDDNRTMLRTVGLREVASGFGILTRPRPAGWLWTRVAGDVMD